MWKYSFAAVPGLGHNRDDYTSCQDVVRGFSNENFTCVCLADGAGSAKFARLGATEIVNSTIQYIETNFVDLFEQDEAALSKMIIENCVASIKSLHEKEECFSIKDYSATLLVVAINGNKCICAHVGDGIIGVKKANGFEILSHPWNGEYKNETVFVTSETAFRTIDVKKFNLESEIGFFVMSDGTQNSFYSSKERKLISVKGLSQLFEFASANSMEDTNAFLDYNLFHLISQNTSDDCSFGLIVNVI